MNTTIPLSPTRNATDMAIQALVELLKHPDPSTRLEAAKALLDARRDGIG